MTNLEQQPLVLKQEVREQKQNETDFASSFSKLQSQEWYKKLSPEQQENVENKYQERFNLQKKLEQKKAEIGFKGVSADIITKGIEKNLPKIEDKEDKIEMEGFEDRVDMINRDIESLKIELYYIELKLAEPTLKTTSEKHNKSFKEGLQSDLKALDKNGDRDSTLKEIVETKDLKTISSGEVYILRKKGYDLSKLFLDGKSEVSKETMKVGDAFTVNFGGNTDLNKTIGAGDLLPIDKISKIRVNGELGTRGYEPRVGYYGTDGKYLAIYDNYNIQIVEEKAYTEAEKSNYEKAFDMRYMNVRSGEIIPKIVDQLGDSKDAKIKLENLYIEDFDILRKALETAGIQIDINQKTGEISTKDGKSLKEVIGIFSSKEGLGQGYLKYKEVISRVCSKYLNISEENLIRLINHENGKWNPIARAPGSTAYGLGQMIDSTWNKYSKSGARQRNNPEHQLEATCDYLTDIMKNKGCSIEHALAYYNTGEGIMKVSNSKAKEYYSKNPAIAGKIPSGTHINSKNYFIGAVAYYNDITFTQASLISSRV